FGHALGGLLDDTPKGEAAIAVTTLFAEAVGADPLLRGGLEHAAVEGIAEGEVAVGAGAVADDQIPRAGGIQAAAAAVNRLRVGAAHAERFHVLHAEVADAAFAVGDAAEAVAAVAEAAGLVQRRAGLGDHGAVPRDRAQLARRHLIVVGVGDA